MVVVQELLLQHLGKQGHQADAVSVAAIAAATVKMLRAKNFFMVGEFFLETGAR